MQVRGYRIFTISINLFFIFNRIANLKALFLQKTKLMKNFFIFISVGSIALASFKCKSGGKPDDPGVDTPSNAPKSMSYSIVSTYPHDTASYTEGLLIYNGVMYEGTGDPEYKGKSKLIRLDLKTGKAEKEISLAKEYFGEGITILNDTVYQLTWKEKKVFVYTLKDFKKIKEFDVTYSEGWGLTNDGKNLIVSTGGSDLLYFEPSTFKLIKSQTITEAGSPSYNINELEYIDGFIYANQYTLPYIFKIDPATGVIVAKADVSDMWKRIKTLNPAADVPNGIAYDAVNKKIYVTGKWWPELYEVQFSQ
jgi:glutaminyl-peptide cyclotransferase